MRAVPLRTYNRGTEFAIDIMVSILRKPANGETTTYDELKRTVPVIKKLEGVDKHVAKNALLEEAEWELLVQRVTSPTAGITMNSAEALDMIDSIVNAPEVKVQEVK